MIIKKAVLFKSAGYKIVILVRHCRSSTIFIIYTIGTDKSNIKEYFNNALFVIYTLKKQLLNQCYFKSLHMNMKYLIFKRYVLMN